MPQAVGISTYKSSCQKEELALERGLQAVEQWFGVWSPHRQPLVAWELGEMQILGPFPGPTRNLERGPAAVSQAFPVTNTGSALVSERTAVTREPRTILNYPQTQTRALPQGTFGSNVSRYFSCHNWGAGGVLLASAAEARDTATLPTLHWPKISAVLRLRNSASDQQH